MTAIIWSKMAPRIDLASLAEAYRSFFFAWSRADGTRTPAVAPAEAASEPAVRRAAGDGTTLFRFHPTGVVRVLTPSEEEAEVRRLYGSASAERARASGR